MQSLVFKNVFMIFFFPYQLTWCQNTVTKVKWKDAMFCAVSSLRLLVDQLWIQDKVWLNFATFTMKKCNSAIITQKVVSKFSFPSSTPLAPASKSWLSSRTQTHSSDLCVQEIFCKCSVLDVLRNPRAINTSSGRAQCVHPKRAHWKWAPFSY